MRYSLWSFARHSTRNKINQENFCAETAKCINPWRKQWAHLWTSWTAIWCQVHYVRGRAHSDATGALPVRERSGGMYQIVFFHEDANFIHIEISKSRKGPDLLAAATCSKVFCWSWCASYYSYGQWMRTRHKELARNNTYAIGTDSGCAASHQQSRTSNWYLERSFYCYSSHSGPQLSALI